MNLTPRQADVIVAIRNYRHLHGYSPTMQELADQLGTSKVTIFEHVGAGRGGGAVGGGRTVPWAGVGDSSAATLRLVGREAPAGGGSACRSPPRAGAGGLPGGGGATGGGRGVKGKQRMMRGYDAMS